LKPWQSQPKPSRVREASFSSHSIALSPSSRGTELRHQLWPWRCQDLNPGPQDLQPGTLSTEQPHPTYLHLILQITTSCQTGVGPFFFVGYFIDFPMCKIVCVFSLEKYKLQKKKVVLIRVCIQPLPTDL
jgi:hypothetical protein